MTIDTTGKWWIGSDAEDLEEYLRAYSEDAYLVHEFRLAHCACGSRTFHLLADEDEGAARRTCASCGTTHFIADSEEYWEDASPETWACVECHSETANVGVGFSLYDDREGVRWLYVGARCAACGVLGCFAGWKVGHNDLSLLERA